MFADFWRHALKFDNVRLSVLRLRQPNAVEVTSLHLRVLHLEQPRLAHFRLAQVSRLVDGHGMHFEPLGLDDRDIVLRLHKLRRLEQILLNAYLF